MEPTYIQKATPSSRRIEQNHSVTAFSLVSREAKDKQKRHREMVTLVDC